MPAGHTPSNSFAVSHSPYYGSVYSRLVNAILSRSRENYRAIRGSFRVIRDKVVNFVVDEIVTRLLTQWGRDKLAAVFCRRHIQTHFLEWKWCISTKMLLKFVPQGPIHIIPYCFRWWLVPARRQATIWINDGLVSWRIYASLGLNEINMVQGYFIQLFWTIICTFWLYHVCCIMYYVRLNNLMQITQN